MKPKQEKSCFVNGIMSDAFLDIEVSGPHKESNCFTEYYILGITHIHTYRHIAPGSQHTDSPTHKHTPCITCVMGEDIKQMQIWILIDIPVFTSLFLDRIFVTENIICIIYKNGHWKNILHDHLKLYRHQ